MVKPQQPSCDDLIDPQEFMVEESKDYQPPSQFPNFQRVTSAEQKEQQKIFDMIMKKSKLPKCSVCGKDLKDTDDQFMLQSTDCFHPAH